MSLNEQEIFEKALAIDADAQRQAFLAEACDNDVNVIREVESLLDSARDAGTFMAKQAAGSFELTANAELTGIGRKPIGKYKLLEQIGEGGFGVVYMAEQREPIERRVALKVIKAGMDTKQVIARFEAERQALALMDHPNVAKVLDADATEDGRPYFVMELVRGVPITEYCDQHDLSTEQRLQLFVLVCSAIQHAHQKGIIHRDIKPNNILVTTNGDQPIPKVIDFGIAKATQGRLTEKTLFTNFRQFIGTPAYMSPEQAQMSAVDVDTRSDVYSLGVLLYELVTGKTPLDSKELRKAGFEELFRRIREDEAPKPSLRLSSLTQEELSTVAKHRRTDPSHLSAEIRGDLDWIVMKAVEKDRSRRYATAESFAQDIRRHLDGDAVTAVPPSGMYLLRKFAQRNRRLLVTTLAIAGSLLLGTIGATWGWVRSVKTKDELASQVTVTSAALEESQMARDLANAERKRAVRAAYLADMQAGHQALELDNLGLAKQILAQNSHFEAGLDPRHWEYRALWQRCQPDYERYFDVRDASSMTVSRNGKRLATTRHVLEIDTGSQVCSLDQLGTVSWVRFSPDGNLLYTADTGGTIRSWTLPKLDPTSLELAHGAEISDAELSPDGRTLVVVSHYKVTVWDAVSGELRDSEDIQGVQRVAMSNDGSICAFNERSTGQIHIHDLESFQRLRSISASGRWGLEFSRDDMFIASSSGYTDPEVLVHRVANGERVASLVGHSHSALHAAYSPDGNTLAVASMDQTVSVWRSHQPTTQTSETTHGYELIAKLRGHESGVYCVAFSADGKQLFSGGADDKVCVWNIENLDRNRWPLTKSKACQWWGWCRPQVSYSPDGRLVATTRKQLNADEVPAGADRTVLGFTIRHADTLEVRETLAESGAVKTGVLYSPVENLVAVGDAEGSLQFVDMDDPQDIDLIHLQDDTPLYPIQFTPDGMRLVCSTRNDSKPPSEQDPMCFVLSVKDRKLIASWHLSPAKDRWSNTVPTSISPDGELVASGHGDGIRLWRVADPRNPVHLPVGNRKRPGEGGTIWSLDFSPDGKLLAVGNDAGLIELLNVKTRNVVGELNGHLLYIGALKFSRDGTRLASVSEGPSEGLKLWDVESRREILSMTITGQTYGNRHVEWSPDGNSIMTMGSDSRVRIWRVPSLREIAEFEQTN